MKRVWWEQVSPKGKYHAFSYNGFYAEINLEAYCGTHRMREKLQGSLNPPEGQRCGTCVKRVDEDMRLCNALLRMSFPGILKEGQ